MSGSLIYEDAMMEPITLYANLKDFYEFDFKKTLCGEEMSCCDFYNPQRNLPYHKDEDLAPCWWGRGG